MLYFDWKTVLLMMQKHSSNLKKMFFWGAPFGYLYFSILCDWMNQDWVFQESILAWLWHHFHVVLGRDEIRTHNLAIVRLSTKRIFSSTNFKNTYWSHIEWQSFWPSKICDISNLIFFEQIWTLPLIIRGHHRFVVRAGWSSHGWTKIDMRGRRKREREREGEGERERGSEGEVERER